MTMTIYSTKPTVSENGGERERMFTGCFNIFGVNGGGKSVSLLPDAPEKGG
jgi:hypothetical protein